MQSSFSVFLREGSSGRRLPLTSTDHNFQKSWRSRDHQITRSLNIMSTTQAEGGTQFQSTQDEGNFKKKILRMNDIKYSSKKTKTVKKSTPKSKHNALRKQGVYFDPVNADPLSSRLVHRFMFAEFLGSLFSNLISQGSVISCGALTYQFNYDELTPGRILCIAFASSFVSFISKKSPFHRCPVKEHCTNATCAPGTDPNSPLCALCSPGYVLRQTCVECSSQSIGPGIGIFAGLFVVLAAVMFVKRAAIRRLQRKYGSLWRDVVRIVTINISFMQINASLPSIMNGVAWPNNYLSFLNRFDVLNLDLMKFFGLPCVNDTLDYRFNVFVALFVPIVIVLLASFMYCLRRRQIDGSAGKIAKDSHLRRTSAEFLFDTLDADDGGNIEVEEFQQLLVYLGKKKVDMSTARKMMHQVKAKSPRPVNTTRRQQRQQRQQQVNGGKNSRSGSSVDELTREEFIRVVVDGSLETITRTGAKWVAVVELERTKASYQAAVLVVLLLMHAPVSQRFFYYFADDNVQGQRYLRSDYSIEYGGKIWSEFLPVVIREISVDISLRGNRAGRVFCVRPSPDDWHSFVAGSSSLLQPSHKTKVGVPVSTVCARCRILGVARSASQIVADGGVDLRATQCKSGGGRTGVRVGRGDFELRATTQESGGVLGGGNGVSVDVL